MSSICYQDWIVMPGEDAIFSLAGLLRAHHGLMRANNLGLVLVPFWLNELNKPSLKDLNCAPQGLRAYFEESDETEYLSNLRISPILMDTIKRKSVRLVDARRVAGEVKVKRRRVKSEPANLRRFQRRNPDVDVSGKVDHWQKSRADRSGMHLWLLRDEGRTKIPFFLKLEIHKSDAVGMVSPALAVANTYGMGTAPLIDFF